MLIKEFETDLAILQDHLPKLADNIQKATAVGKHFYEVKLVHLQIIELTRLIVRIEQLNEHMSYG